MTRAVFLDRDGVLNKAYVRNGKPYSPDTIEEMIIPPDAAEALGRLRRHGFRLILASKLPLDGVEMCTHDDADNCDCRKPKPGLLLQAAEREGIDLAQSFMVGDRYRDIEAGHSAGCRTILIGDGYGERFKAQPDATVSTLTEATDWILKQPVTKD